MFQTPVYFSYMQSLVFVTFDLHIQMHFVLLLEEMALDKGSV